MNVMRRGTVGVALFVSGVLSIPAVMMADNHARTDLDVDALTPIAGSTSPTTLGTSDGRGPIGAPTGTSGLTFGSAVGAASSSAGSGAPATRTLAAGGRTGAAAPQTPAVVGVDGVTEGAVLSGEVSIRALVSGPVKIVQFSLRGTAMLGYLSVGQPFLLAPNGLGLDTTALPNGPYTLLVTTYDPPSRRTLRIDFRIVNAGGSVLSQPPNNQSVSYYLR